jgi:predicted ABC-class ATPase
MEKIDHRSYPAYKDLKGEYQFDSYLLKIVHVQSDPFARASDLQVILPNTFDKQDFDTPYKKRALADFLLRLFEQNLNKAQKRQKSKKESLLSLQHPGQQVLERSSLRIHEEQIIFSFHVSFPATGRKILVSSLIELLFDTLPKLITQSFLYDSISPAEKQKLKNAIALSMDQHLLRKQMKEKGMAAFVANGSMLPRKSGNCDLPLKDGVPFVSPKSLETTLQLANGKTITGMAIPQGITLICGGGYHGKSTLLSALEKGVYDHIEGDGREYVLSDASAVKIRAEDGRSIQNEDISAFIQNLPQKKDTVSFSTENASGSTSQAAALMEALQADCKLLLIDEDTSASNFLFRDEMMSEIIPSDKEPIIPLLNHMKKMYEQAGVSTILVAGSSSAFFLEADCILAMDEYEPKDITEFVKEKIKEHPQKLIEPIQKDWSKPLKDMQITTEKESERLKIKTKSKDKLLFNHKEIDTKAIEQITEEGQLKMAGYLLAMLAKKYPQQTLYLPDVLKQAKNEFISELLESGQGKDLSEIRLQEIPAVFGRIRP